MGAEALSLAFLGDPNSIHTRRWVGFFAQKGHRVHLLVGEDQPIEPGLDPAIVVERFRDHGRRLRPAGAWRARRSLRQLLARLNPDVLHAHYLTRFGWLGWLADHHPFVVTVWGTDVYRSINESLAVRLAGWFTLRSADLVTAVTADLGRAAVRAGARPDRVRVVQFGFDSARFIPGPASPELRARLALDRRRVVLAPRFLRTIYRQETVVRALVHLPEDVIVLMTRYQADPAVEARILGLAQELGVSERLRLLGPIPHEAMPDYLRLADAVVSVPESDAFPVSVLEAMACARPVVVSDVPSAREVLGDIAPEMIVPVDDDAALAAALTAALDMDADAASTRLAGLRALAVARADETSSLEAMEVAYRDLVTAARTAR